MRVSYSYCPFDGSNLSPTTGQQTCPKCGFIDHMNAKPCVGVVVEREGSVLLGAKKNGGQRLWDILGGFINPGETAEEEAAREVREEAALELTNLRYFMSAVDTYPPRDEPTLTLCFTAAPINWPPKAGSDIDELRTFLSDEVDPIGWAPNRVE